MLNKTTIENTLIAWVNGVTGEPCIVADPSKPRPTTAYSMIDIPAFVPVGTSGIEETSLPSDLVQLDYSTNYDIQVSLNFYRTDAFLSASNVRDSLDLTTILETLETAGLFYISTSDIRHISDVIKKKFEERYQFDVSFYVRSLETETLEQIKKIEVTNELDETTEIIE
jgi:hypothetical protein